MIKAIIAVSITLTLFQASANAKEPIILQPSSEWVVISRDDSCRLARQFGEGDDTVFAFFDRYSPGDNFHLTLGGNRMKAKRASVNVDIRFGPTEAKQSLSFFKGKLSGGQPAFLQRSAARIAAETEDEVQLRAKADPTEVPIPLAELGTEREAAVTFLEIGKPLIKHVILATGSMQEPFAKLRQCTAELLTHWGVDVEKHAKLTRAVLPKNSPSTWMVSSDYPFKMDLDRTRAIVRFRLSIDTAGNVTECHIRESARPIVFDEAVCKAVMKRAQFSPALDEQGNPINSYYLNTVIFDILRSS